MKPLRHKYNARPTEALGRKYGSAKEAKYAEKLAIAQSTGALLGWMEQVPIRLPGKTTYRLDFLEFWANGEVIATEVKGMETPTWKIKKRQLAELYPWLPINVVTKV